MSRVLIEARVGGSVPTYQYTCTECGEPVEAVQKFTDAPLTVCAACGGRLRKVFSPVGIVFKGSGFYRTDTGTVRVPTPRPRTRRWEVLRQVVLHLIGLRTATARRTSRPPRSPTRRRPGQVVSREREGRLSGHGRPGGPTGGSRGVVPPGQHRRRRRFGLLRVQRTRRRGQIDTPFGAPSDPITVGEVSGRPVAFLPGTAATTGSRRTRSRTGRTCGRCAPSASGGCSPRPRSAR